MAFRIHIPDTVSIQAFDPADLPADWRQEPPPHSAQELGTRLLQNTCLLSVPSAIIPQERNFVINPLHPHFRKIKIRSPEPFSYDPRLWR